jgi:type IV secretory pathway VirB4 component
VELAEAGVLNIINESCPTKIFLANPNIYRKLYAEIFQFTDTQLELFGSLVPKRDLLLIQPDIFGSLESISSGTVKSIQAICF